MGFIDSLYKSIKFISEILFSCYVEYIKKKKVPVLYLFCKFTHINEYIENLW